MKKLYPCPWRRLFGRFFTAALACVVFSPFPLSSASAAPIAAGGQHSAVLSSDGTVWTWGGNSHGQLGLGSLETEPIPERVTTLSAFKLLASGHAHTFGLAADGRLFAWGRNLEGQLGLGDRQNRGEPVQVGLETDWEALAAGAFHAVGIRDGNLFAWGSNSAGQIGNGSYSAVLEPVEIGNGETWLAVAAGEFHSLAVRADGTLWAWGSNIESQLGIPLSSTNIPVQVGDDTDWQTVAGGAWHSLALKSDGSLWSWGRNWEGQLGVGAGATGNQSPSQVGSHFDWVVITAGRTHSAGLRAEGAVQTLWTWGANGDGQLGDGSSTQRWRPVPIGNETDWLGVAAGRSHTVGLTSDYRVLSTGSNGNSQLGIGRPEVDQVNRLHAAVFRKPDLEVTAVEWDSLDPLGVFGEPFEVTLEWRNSGSAPVPETLEFDIQLLLIGAGGVDDGIVLLEESVTRRIEVGEEITQNFSVISAGGIPAGEYRLAVILDSGDVIDETVVENNIGWADTSRLFLSDLRVAGIDLSAVSLLPGAETEFEITVENFGIADLADVSFDVRLSLRPETGDDYLLPADWKTVEAFGAGDTVQLSIPATLPVHLPPGDYRLLVELNSAGALQELSDANNSGLSASAFITVGGVSLAEALGQPDLIFSQSDERLWFGQTQDGFSRFRRCHSRGRSIGRKRVV